MDDLPPLSRAKQVKFMSEAATRRKERLADMAANCPTVEIALRIPTKTLDKVDVLANAMDKTRQETIIKLLNTVLQEG